MRVHAFILENHRNGDQQIMGESKIWRVQNIPRWLNKNAFLWFLQMQICGGVVQICSKNTLEHMHNYLKNHEKTIKHLSRNDPTSFQNQYKS